jgi:hypothetical protein
MIEISENQYGIISIIVNVPGFNTGRGCGFSAVGSGAAPNSAVGR